MKFFLSLGMKKRIDLILVELGLCPSRSKAKELIENAAVEVLHFEGPQKDHWAVCDDPAALFEVEVFKIPRRIRINDARWIKYVSRAGLKLEGALDRLRLDVQGLKILDVGQSTGGFTDALILRGAAHVVGFDVGHDQLHPKLKSRENISSFEGVNAKESHLFEPLKKYLGSMDLSVGDVSFISVGSIFPSITKFLRPGGALLFLIKPQFELNREALDKNGIVKDKNNYAVVEKKTRQWLEDLSFRVIDYFPSSIEGQNGNKEFFIYGRKNS